MGGWCILGLSEGFWELKERHYKSAEYCLTGRDQRMHIQGVFWICAMVTCKDPQGLLLGQLLYLIYVRLDWVVPECFLRSKSWLKYEIKSIAKYCRDPNKMHQWLDRWVMTLLLTPFHRVHHQGFSHIHPQPIPCVLEWNADLYLALLLCAFSHSILGWFIK